MIDCLIYKFVDDSLTREYSKINKDVKKEVINNIWDLLRYNTGSCNLENIFELRNRILTMLNQMFYL
jgi:hypothetical protein